MMATYRVHFKSKGGDQYMLIDAASKEQAQKDAVQAQSRRHGRFPLTFQRLEQSLDSGEMHPMLAANRKLASMAHKDVAPFVKAEIELRKRDQARYDDDDLKIVAVEKV